MPLGHLGINVPDLAAAKLYYDELLPLLSFRSVPSLERHDQVAYLPAGGEAGTWLFFYPAGEQGDGSRHRTGLQHLAFTVRTRAEVDAVHAWVVARGDEVVHPPREWPEYHRGYYATFWLDPHGFLLEAVCHRDSS